MTFNPSEKWSSVLEVLSKGEQIITASNRQADFLHEIYRQQQENEVWPRANITTYQAWVAAQIELCHMQSQTAVPVLLNQSQTRFLWQKVIATEEDPLLNTSLAARKANRAAEILHQWLATDSLNEPFLYEHRLETRQFSHWYLTIQQECQQASQIPAYAADGYLLSCLENLELKTTTKQVIHTYGFQQPTPIQKKLSETLSHQGMTIKAIAGQEPSAVVSRLEFTDLSSEIKQAAEWAAKEIANNPEQRLGVIIPELEQHRARVKRYFSKVFNRNYWLDPGINTQASFDISLAPSMADYPMVQDLLLLLSLVRGRQELFEFIQWIQSPFLGKLNNHALAQALIELAQNYRYPSIKQQHLNQMLTKGLALEFQSDATLLKPLMLKLQSMAKQAPQKPSDWLNDTLELIQLCDFAPEATLNSNDYQTRQALLNVLESLAGFDLVVTNNMPWFDFLQLLRRELSGRLFQPQTGHCAVQIMGVFEALAIDFDQIRMLGVDNTFWPAKTSPNPFLPFSLQRELDMPNASTSRELQLCEMQYRSLQSQCDKLILSHVNDSKDVGERLSPIVQQVPVVVADTANTRDEVVQSIYAERANLQVIPVVDNYASRIIDQDIKGGSGLIKDIAQCPFRAYIHFRLKVKAPDEPKADFDAMDKGNLVHEVLEILWREEFNFSQQRLIHCLNQVEFEDRLLTIISDSLQTMQSKQGFRFNAASLALEQKRLYRVITEWLTIDAQRQPFEVLEVEELHEAKLHTATINLKIDRVDKLSDGRYVIIDYKTGKVEIKNWFGERPEEPQLPLYACLMDDQKKPIAAVSFALVKHQNCEFKGLSDDKFILPGIKLAFPAKQNTQAKHLSEQIPLWQANLENLMQEYLSGYAAVKPKAEKVCDYCDLKPVCRITEINVRPALEVQE